jgi:hypothetical protein
VPRTWDNLFSMVSMPVPNAGAYARVVDSIIREAPDKELVQLVHWGRTSTKEDARRHIQLFTSLQMIRGSCSCGFWHRSPVRNR